MNDDRKTPDPNWTVVVHGDDQPARPRVLNLGTAEKPNYAGSAHDVGWVRGYRAGIEKALETLRGVDQSRDEYVYDNAVEAIVGLLK